MKKTKLVNEKVIRAIALGLSAVMLTSPMQALAAEGETPTPTPEPKDVDVKEGSKYEAAEDAVEAAQDSTSDGGSIALEGTEVLPSGSTITTVPNAEAAAGAEVLEDVTTTLQGEEVDYEDVAEDEKDANDKLDSAEAGLIQTDTAEEAAAGKVNEADKLISEVEEGNAAIKDAGTAAEDAAQKAEEAAKEAEEAQTQEEAQAAVEKAQAAAKEAEAKAEEAQKTYDENVDKLADAEAELQAANAKLEAAKASLTATAEDVAAAEAAVVSAEAKADALKKEVDASAKELEASKEARLKAAYEKMKATAAADNLTENHIYTNINAGKDEDADGVDDEYSETFGKEHASSTYWNDSLEYFKLYIQYIYGDDATYEWTKTGPEYAKENVYAVTYKETTAEGQEVEVTKYFNYHLADTTGEISIYEKKLDSKTEIEVSQTQVKENVFSIKNEDGTYTKYDDVKKEDDIVVNNSVNEKEEVDSILVKDENSQLLDSEDITLSKNQSIQKDTESVEYTKGTITVPASYATKEVNVDYVDRLGSYNNLVKKVDEYNSKYPATDGYRLEIVFDRGFGNDEVITLEQAKELDIESKLGAGWDCGFEIKVYQTIEDKDKVTAWETKDCIVKTTYADVVTTKDNYVSNTRGNREKAEKEAKEKVKELGLKAGEYIIKYETVWNGPFNDDCKYTIIYKTTTTEKKAVLTEKYSATYYGKNEITTDKTIEVPVEKKYWTERKNTTKDAVVKAAIDGITQKLTVVKQQQDAAAIALIAAQEAKKDVEAAKKALEGLKVGTAAYDAALEKYEAAKKNLETAKTTLDKINENVEKAQKDYENAAGELGRFGNEDGSNENPSGGGAGAGGAGGTGTGGTGGTGAGGAGTGGTGAGGAGIGGAGATTNLAAAGGAGANAQNIVNIADEDTPLAAGIGGAGGQQNISDAADEDDENDAAVEITDEATPLAAGIGTNAETNAKMSWWWLLIVALFGATGYKMYQEHQKKKEEAQEK